MAKCSPKASKKGRLVIKLTHKETGEFYMTTINDKEITTGVPGPGRR